jgi:hypothetical protein
MASLAQAVDTQHCEEWCWAASISMIFAFHGHPIAQERIVADTYGAVVCLPAGVTATIGSDLSRYYTDDNGVAFRSIVSAAYDPANGIRTLSNAMIVAELLNNRPLLYCNRQHAEVLYSVTYDGSADAPNIVEADVIDPWPFNPRLHALSPSELAPVDYGGDMTFLAAVTVL